MAAAEAGASNSAAGQARVLVVDDEPATAEAICSVLSREGWDPVVADAGTALERFQECWPAAVVLDLTLPALHGLELCRTLRMRSQVPILILSGVDTEQHRVAALEMGADDFIAKPFSLRELESRIRARTRRAALASWSVPPPRLLAAGPIELDDDRHDVHVRGRPVALTRKEFDLLRALLIGGRRLRTRGYLMNEVWGPRYIGTSKTLDVHVKRLRQKIERDPHKPEHIITVRGLGYRFVDEP